MSERWADIEGFEGLYQVSDQGNVRSLRTGKNLSTNSKTAGGYVPVQLHKNGKPKRTVIHRLVAAAFVDGEGPEVNHKNGCKTDNRAENLEWVTRSENVTHAYYELGYRVRPVIAISSIDGSKREYRSVCEAARDGFRDAHIYRCLNNPHKIAQGYYWRRPAEAKEGEK